MILMMGRMRTKETGGLGADVLGTLRALTWEHAIIITITHEGRSCREHGG